MSFRLIDKKWGNELWQALAADASCLRIVCPFIKVGALEQLLSREVPKSIQVITRYNLGDFEQGVSDLKALMLLLSYGAKIRGIRNLHAKMFLFGSSQAVVTSANLTSSGLTKNHEFGFISDEASVIQTSHRYFDRLWADGKADLQTEKLLEWQRKIESYFASGGRPSRIVGLGDEGVNVGLDAEPNEIAALSAYEGQAFVKFLGRGSDRAPDHLPVLDEIKRSGCHWAVGYPASQRPRQVKDGATILMGRLTKGDIKIFGRAIGMAHKPGRDDATEEEKEELNWKRKWPRYIRVHNAQFVAGNMKNGVSLYEMMERLKFRSFATTSRNKKAGNGNTDARKAYGRKPAVELSDEGFQWLNTRLDEAFRLHGTVAAEELDRIGWPILPRQFGDKTEKGDIERIEALLKKRINSDKPVIFYEPVMALVGLDHTRTNDRKRIGHLLELVSEKSLAEHGVLLSVLVHRKKTGRTSPGEGFRKLVQRLGYVWKDYDVFLTDETRKAIAAYS